MAVQPTLADVAALAGVSPITVSRALRTPALVAPETRERVEAAVRQIGYVPNHVAGALASARSRAVAVLVPTIANSIFADTVEGLSTELEAQGYAVLLGQSRYEAVWEERMLAALLGRRPEALVLVGAPMTETGRAMLRRPGVTVVETWDLPAAPIDAVVGFDNHATGEAVARHFVASGRHRLGFVGGSDTRSERRWAGFVAATRTAGLAMPHRITVPVVASAEAAAALVPALGEVDAIFATTDVYALGLLSGLHRAGRRVPDDVALVGLGDLEMARLASPALSSVRIDGRAIGQVAAKLILGAKGPRYIDLGFELVLRESA